MKSATFEIEGFCSCCPPAEEVLAALRDLDFRLDFSLDALSFPDSVDLAPMPAQYFYEGPCGVSIIYLAGVDPEGKNLPFHSSRFWICAQMSAYWGYRGWKVQQQAVSVLAGRWRYGFWRDCQSRKHHTIDVGGYPLIPCWWHTLSKCRV